MLILYSVAMGEGLSGFSYISVGAITWTICVSIAADVITFYSWDDLKTYAEWSWYLQAC